LKKISSDRALPGSPELRRLPLRNDCKESRILYLQESRNKAGVPENWNRFGQLPENLKGG
jgi:hypothetical protein